jgi:hypothetical protein
MKELPSHLYNSPALQRSKLSGQRILISQVGGMPMRRYPNPPICPLNLQFNISLPLELTPEEHKGNLSALLHHLNRQHLPIVNAMA